MHKNLNDVCKEITSYSPFFKKSIESTYKSSDQEWKNFSEEWVTFLLNTFKDNGKKLLAKDYVEYTKMIRIEELHFHKNKKYRYTDFEEVAKRVYENDERMRHYVTGLGMTQIFWINHYRIIKFFNNNFLPFVKDAKKGAECGVGHGYFHMQLLRNCPNINTKIFDLSDYAMNFAKQIFKIAKIDINRVETNLGDIQKGITIEDESLDVLLLGEIIEHLTEGHKVMKTLSKKLKKSGKCFFTTAANAPAEDHVLLFRSVKEIRDFVDECSWKVIEEHIDTTNDVPLEKAEEELININYSAVLEPR